MVRAVDMYLCRVVHVELQRQRGLPFGLFRRTYPQDRLEEGGGRREEGGGGGGGREGISDSRDNVGQISDSRAVFFPG